MNKSYANKKVLAFGAHPDDIEFACGATMAMLADAGAEVHFVIITDGNRGSRQHSFEKKDLVASRQTEAENAASILGAKSFLFLEEEDGNLIADIAFKERIVRAIRTIKPDMVFGHDPSWYYSNLEKGGAAVNHTDHRAAGEAVIDAVYPLARDLQSFPDQILEGLDAHVVPELYLFSHGVEPNFAFDVTGFVETKIKSIHAHVSQIDDPEGLAKRMTDRAEEVGKRHGFKHGEAFTQLLFT